MPPNVIYFTLSYLTPPRADLAIAAFNQQQNPAGLVPSGSNFSSHTMGGARTGSLGNLSSAMLSAVKTPVPQTMGGGGKTPMVMGGTDSLMSAYLGMYPGSQQHPYSPRKFYSFSPSLSFTHFPPRKFYSFPPPRVSFTLGMF